MQKVRGGEGKNVERQTKHMNGLIYIVVSEYRLQSMV